jgi:hypothetical protein
MRNSCINEILNGVEKIVLDPNYKLQVNCGGALQPPNMVAV